MSANGIFTVKYNVQVGDETEERKLFFRYTFRSVKALRNHFNCKLSELEAKLKDPDIEDIEALLYYGLIWKDRELTREEAEEWIDQASMDGKMQECIEAASKALNFFFGMTEDDIKNAQKATKAKK